MATAPDAVRAQLAVVTTSAAADLASVSAQAPRKPVDAALNALPLVVPAYYDAAASLAVAWYDERRSESNPVTSYVPRIIGNPSTDWIDREVAKFAKQFEADLEAEAQKIINEAVRLAEKEVARGFRDSILGNSHSDKDSIGWSRIARPGACKFCVMLADRGAVFTEATADFAAHGDCHCATRPEFRNGEHGPEASVMQYLASTKKRTPKQRAVLRDYLNLHYPDLPG